MFQKLQSDPLIKKILKLHDRYGNTLQFHRNCSSLIKKFNNPEFITNVFIQNIKDKRFILKEWKSYEIPHLVIFENENIRIVYNIFSPVINESSETAAHLIHHHKSNILSSYIMAGPGYHTIEFEKEIKYFDNNCYDLKPSKSFLHKKYNLNILKENIPHLIFNVPETTISIALWTEKKEENFENNNSSINYERTSYFKKNGVYHGISENNFIYEISRNINYQCDSEIHIQIICYFFQEFGSKKNSNFQDFISNSHMSEKWRYWLNMACSNNKINAPLLKNNLNTLGNKMKIENFNY